MICEIEGRKMLGFHPLGTQTFSSALPFVDIQATTNLVSTAIGSAVSNPTVVISSANLEMTAAQGSVTGSQLPIIAFPSGNELAAGINSVAPFTWAQVSDTTNETWSQVSQASSETWTEVSDTTNETWSQVSQSSSETWTEVDDSTGGSETWSKI
jgi:hypothetical protein|tara:strand:- start:1586 stop:2050 length:465 start_codon:yes stop_codon:yes gene_type:complete